MDLLLRHGWPGNVRELENVIERAVIMARGDTVMPENFPANFDDRQSSGSDRELILSSGRSLKEVEKEMILKTLEEMDGNRTHTAELLGISRRTLQLKLREYGVNQDLSQRSDQRSRSGRDQI
jgi:two-component system response regulator HydG